MSGWILTTGIWFLLVAAIYFIGNIQQLQLLQNYDAFQSIFTIAHTATPLEDECSHRDNTELFLRYQRCQHSQPGQLQRLDPRAAVLQDLAIGPERLHHTRQTYELSGEQPLAFIPFMSDLEQQLAFSRSLVILADEGSSAHLPQVRERLEGSNDVWGGIVQPGQRLFADYSAHVQANDGVWRSLKNKDWLLPWQADTPHNRLQAAPEP